MESSFLFVVSFLLPFISVAIWIFLNFEPKYVPVTKYTDEYFGLKSLAEVGLTWDNTRPKVFHMEESVKKLPPFNWSIDYITTSYGEEKFTDARTGEDFTIQLGFKKGNIQLDEDSAKHFIRSHPDLLQQFQRTIVSLLPHLDLSLNAFQENGLEQEDTQYEIWFASPNRTTLIHRDDDFGNLLFHVEGKKKIYFWPPEDESYLYITPPAESGRLYDLETYYKASMIDPQDDYVLWKFPKFIFAKGAILNLQPGDIVFIPGDWFHYTLYEDMALSFGTTLFKKEE